MRFKKKLTLSRLSISCLISTGACDKRILHHSGLGTGDHKQVISDLYFSSLLDELKENATGKPSYIYLHQNISKNAPFKLDSLLQLCSRYKKLKIFHFGISSENISTTKMKLPLNSMYNAGF